MAQGSQPRSFVPSSRARREPHTSISECDQ